MKRLLQALALAALLVTVCSLTTPATARTTLDERIKTPEPGMVQMVTLGDGSTLIGRITDVGDDNVTIQTDLGEMTIDRYKIRDVEELPQSRFRNGRYWAPNPNQTRLLVGPTARTLEAGSGYLFDLWLFFPGVAYGVTDNFMISGGVSIFPDTDNQLFYFIPKIGFSATEQIDIAASVMILHLDNTAYLGMGNITYGTDDYNLTGGIAVAWNEDEMQDEPALMAGGEYRVARRISLVGESWFIPGGDGGKLLMPAVRFFGEKMTVDLGIAYSASNDDADDPWDDDDAGWIPYLDFVWNF
jgi:hypothetical protein